jgi:hypothetical protein
MYSDLIAKHGMKEWPEASVYDLAKQLLASDFAEEKLAASIVLSSKAVTQLHDWEEQLRFLRSAFFELN